MGPCYELLEVLWGYVSCLAGKTTGLRSGAHMLDKKNIRHRHNTSMLWCPRTQTPFEMTSAVADAQCVHKLVSHAINSLKLEGVSGVRGETVAFNEHDPCVLPPLRQGLLICSKAKSLPYVLPPYMLEPLEARPSEITTCASLELLTLA